MIIPYFSWHLCSPIDPQDPNKGNILRSLDYGATWTASALSFKGNT
jgi:hypothetical protein